MTHYDILGIPRDTTANDIKRAFRRRASEMLSNYEMTEETLTALISGWKAGT